jgi:hypothetical protein
MITPWLSHLPSLDWLVLGPLRWDRSLHYFFHGLQSKVNLGSTKKSESKTLEAEEDEAERQTYTPSRPGRAV